VEGVEQVGSEMRVEAEAETSRRASDEAPGELRKPTQDKRARRITAPSEGEAPLGVTNLKTPRFTLGVFNIALIFAYFVDRINKNRGGF